MIEYNILHLRSCQEVPICLRQDDHSFGWRTVVKDIQNVICTY